MDGGMARMDRWMHGEVKTEPGERTWPWLKQTTTPAMLEAMPGQGVPGRPCLALMITVLQD